MTPEMQRDYWAASRFAERIKLVDAGWPRWLLWLPRWLRR
jgi:hypothetical protein